MYQILMFENYYLVNAITNNKPAIYVITPPSTTASKKRDYECF